MAIRTCDSCGIQNDSDAKFCCKCGKQLALNAVQRALPPELNRIDNKVQPPPKHVTAAQWFTPKHIHMACLWLGMIFGMAIFWYLLFIGKGINPFKKGYAWDHVVFSIEIVFVSGTAVFALTALKKEPTFAFIRPKEGQSVFGYLKAIVFSAFYSVIVGLTFCFVMALAPESAEKQAEHERETRKSEQQLRDEFAEHYRKSRLHNQEEEPTPSDLVAGIAKTARAKRTEEYWRSAVVEFRTNIDKMEAGAPYSQQITQAAIRIRTEVARVRAISTENVDENLVSLARQYHDANAKIAEIKLTKARSKEGDEFDAFMNKLSPDERQDVLKGMFVLLNKLADEGGEPSLLSELIEAVGKLVVIRVDLQRRYSDRKFPEFYTPRDAADFIERGEILYDGNEFENAVEDFTKAIQLAPNSARAYSGRGLARASMNNLDEAVTDYDSAIRLDPNETTTYVKRGLVWEKKHDPNRALNDFNQAIRLKPNYAFAYTRRGLYWYSQGELDKALADSDKAIQLSPDDAFSYVFRGYVYRDKGEEARAELDFAKARKLGWRPDSPAQNKSFTNSIDMKLAYIPPGKFTMGSPVAETDRDRGEDRVFITVPQGFYLGRYEVTQGEWKQVMFNEPWKGKTYVNEGSDYPATYVSWDDAVAFCKRLTDSERRKGVLLGGHKYELPSEAQWEYACRAGTTTAYSFGDDKSGLEEYAWYHTNAWYVGEKYAHRVGQKLPNGWGLYDMHGNVWEWCSDNIRRGGAWNYSAPNCRSAKRDACSPDYRIFNLGFRVALIPTTE